MSPANVSYVLDHNPEVDSGKVEVSPNCIEVRDLILSPEEKMEMRKKYNIPVDKTVFVYGGNLGRPQGIPFLIDCLRTQKNRKDAFFMVAGDGTEFNKLSEFTQQEKAENIRLFQKLPKEDYDRMIAACDVGMIFLDHRFTIPNFPSRLLPYMQVGLPVLACTDPNTDVGKVITEGKFGWWCESDNPEKFSFLVDEILKQDVSQQSQNAVQYLKEHYDAALVYQDMMQSIFHNL